MSIIDNELEKLKFELENHTGQRQGGLDCAIPELAICRFTAPSEPQGWLYEPSIAIAAQGAKRITIADRSFCYRPRQILLTSIDIPTLAQVCEATEENPFLALVLWLDLSQIPKLLTQSHFSLLASKSTPLAQAVTQIDSHVLSAVNRLVALLNTPEDIDVLSPIIQTEILYYLLKSDQGAQLQLMATQNQQCRQINCAIKWLKTHYDKPILIEELCDLAQMSASSFHLHFKNVTSMTPLQYQKWLRLNEARRLMVIEMMDAAETAFRVGYESASQFNREYRRLFGLPPGQDIKRLRQGAIPA